MNRYTASGRSGCKVRRKIFQECGEGDDAKSWHSRGIHSSTSVFSFWRTSFMLTQTSHRSRLFLFLAASFAGSLFFVGCDSSQNRDDATSGDHAVHTIQVLYFDGCPNTPPVIQSAKAAARDLGDDWRVEAIDLESLSEDDTRRGYGSPTVLYQDRDLFGLPTPTSNALSCRHYPGGNPTSASIRSALER